MIAQLYENFKHWSATGSVWLLSDPHFNDADCKLMDKGWIEPEEQLTKIKAKVHKNDTFICLGDCGDLSYFKEIKAHKVLIKGNHDDKAKDKYKDIFDEIYDGALMIGPKLLLSHEPVEGLKWCLNIHGHDHGGKMNKDKYHLNLAANVCGYEPVSLAVLIKNGALSKIDDIHRQTIDKATKRKVKKHGKK